MGLLAYSRTVVTDSGGVQEEAMVTETPTVTLRYSTERPETVACGLNILAGAATDRIVSNTLRQASKTERPAIRTNPFGDGRSGTRIGRIISRALEDKPHTLDFRKDPYVTYALSGKGRERPHIAYLSSYDTDGLALSTKDTKRRRYRVVRGPISSLRRL